MGFINKLFGQKSEKEKNVQNNSEEIKLKTLKSIYPYFKQFMPSSGDSIELPTDFIDIDKSKVYHHPSIKPIIKDICEDLNCLYAIDNEYGYEIIQEDKLADLQLSKDELHEIALSNFRQLISTNMKAHGDTNGIMFTVNGNLEAGLVLVDEIWEQLQNQIGEEVVIAVPSRDVIVATGKSNRSMIDNFSQKAKTILEGGDHPLSKNWFVWRNKKWELFEPIIK
jgi:uncharacterized protein YtpQ (UPF0354 family)